MKKFYILLVIALQFSLTSVAKIWRVNNIAGITADFTTAQAAHDGAAAGDTIHLEPSNSSYGNLNMTKKLCIVGTGQFASNNPGFQQDIKNGFVGNVNIANAGANGSSLSIRYAGNFTITTAVVGNIALLNCASITGQQCTLGFEVGMLFISAADNITINGGWFAGIDVRDEAQNILISNNIIGNRIAVRSGSSATIRNNVICALSPGGCTNMGIQNSLVVNNIFNKGMIDIAEGLGGTTFQNNMSANAFLPAGNGNVNNVDMATIFENNLGGFVDNVYRLKVGSPAIAAGLNGENLGAFGGTNPFRLAVTPAIPSIYKLAVPATPSGSTMNIVFSTRSNQ